MADSFVKIKKQLKKAKIEREALESNYFEMQERVKEIEKEIKKKREDFKDQLVQISKDHEKELEVKDLEYKKLKEKLDKKEKQKKEFELEIKKYKQKEEEIKKMYIANNKGDPQGPIPSIDYIKSMDLDDIDLITERLWKYGLTVENKENQQPKRNKKHPRIPMLDLDIVFKMIERDNEYEEYEEEEEEAEEDWQSGKTEISYLNIEVLHSDQKKFFQDGSALVSDASHERREELKRRKEQIVAILNKTYEKDEENESEVPVSSFDKGSTLKNKNDDSDQLHMSF